MSTGGTAPVESEPSLVSRKGDESVTMSSPNDFDFGDAFSQPPPSSSSSSVQQRDAVPEPEPQGTYNMDGSVNEMNVATVEDDFQMFSSLGAAPSATPTLEELDASLAELEDDDAWEI